MFCDLDKKAKRWDYENRNEVLWYQWSALKEVSAELRMAHNDQRACSLGALVMKKNVEYKMKPLKQRNQKVVGAVT